MVKNLQCIFSASGDTVCCAEYLQTCTFISACYLEMVKTLLSEQVQHIRKQNAQIF